jgi:hypothetical protein
MKFFDRSARAGVARRRRRRNEIALWRVFSRSPESWLSDRRFIEADVDPKIESVTQGCGRALGCSAPWVNDPRGDSGDQTGRSTPSVERHGLCSKKWLVP